MLNSVWITNSNFNSPCCHEHIFLLTLLLHSNDFQIRFKEVWHVWEQISAPSLLSSTWIMIHTVKNVGFRLLTMFFFCCCCLEQMKYNLNNSMTSKSMFKLHNSAILFELWHHFCLHFLAATDCSNKATEVDKKICRQKPFGIYVLENSKKNSKAFQGKNVTNANVFRIFRLTLYFWRFLSPTTTIDSAICQMDIYFSLCWLTYLLTFKVHLRLCKYAHIQYM